jgi:hypothetical protein
VNAQPNSIPVVDVDNAFPAMVERPTGRRDVAIPGDVGPQVTTALRDILGWRPRAADPKAFEGALRAAFRLRLVEGHVESDFVPRGYAVQADLGAVTGGQASLYRRATIARSEALRILDALVPLRPDADADDMESYRLLVRNGVERLVDEIGAAGGPRVQMVDMYFAGLTGSATPVPGGSADTVAGQLGALRDRFGLTDGNVNTVEEEGVRTAYWTLVDLVTDLQGSWSRQVQKFTGGSGQGFLGTELILLSRLMEAAADQVEEVEDILDSVLVTESERRTLVLDQSKGLTLDGLLTWIHDFLSHEGRRIAQDAGRDGIVSALAPMVVELVKTFKTALADRVEQSLAPEECDDECAPVTWLPASCCAELPAGLYAARSRIAIASLCRLLLQLARTAQRVGRWAQPVVLTVSFKPVELRNDVLEAEFRGLNLRLNQIPGFILDPDRFGDEACRIDDFGTNGIALPLRGSATADDESVSGLFRTQDIMAVFKLVAPGAARSEMFDVPFVVPAEVLPLAIIDGELGQVVHAPTPISWPGLQPIWTPYKIKRQPRPWPVPADERFVPANLVTNAGGTGKGGKGGKGGGKGSGKGSGKGGGKGGGPGSTGTGPVGKVPGMKFPGRTHARRGERAGWPAVDEDQDGKDVDLEIPDVEGEAHEPEPGEPVEGAGEEHVEIDKMMLAYLSTPEFRELLELVNEHDLKTEVNRLMSSAGINIQLRKA